MKSFRRDSIIGIIFVLAAGSLAHFLYDWLGKNVVVGLFVPVNESVWEHMKLLFFPMLLYALWLIVQYKEQYPCVISSLCFGILTGTFLIPVLFYAYTGILGKDIFLLDIGTFILSTLAAFWLSYKLTRSCRAEPYTRLLCTMAGILLICFMWFTYHPPEAELFADLADWGAGVFPGRQQTGLVS